MDGLQTVEYQILKEFVKICKNNHLQYFLVEAQLSEQSGITVLFRGMMILMSVSPERIISGSLKLRRRVCPTIIFSKHMKRIPRTM